MGMTATTEQSGRLDVGDTWRLGVLAVDDHTGQPVDVTVTAEVTLPDDTTTAPTVEQLSTGRYEAEYVLDQPGRHVAVLTASGELAEVVVFATTAVDPGGPPDLTALKAYLKGAASSRSDAELQEALDTETRAQARVCRVDVYDKDLREAVLRRVQCNLARRALPLAVLQSDAEGGSVVMPGNDPEVRRLERTHRKMIAV